jgi:hypothetical protein
VGRWVVKIIRHETRPCGDGNGGSVCVVCRERFPHRTAAVMVVREDYVFDLGISEQLGSLLDIHRDYFPEIEVEPCRPEFTFRTGPLGLGQTPGDFAAAPRMVIHRVRGDLLDADVAQYCADCGAQVDPGPDHFEGGDVFELKDRRRGGVGTFYHRNGISLNMAWPEADNARRCRP